MGPGGGYFGGRVTAIKTASFQLFSDFSVKSTRWFHGLRTPHRGEAHPWHGHMPIVCDTCPNLPETCRRGRNDHVTSSMSARTGASAAGASEQQSEHDACTRSRLARAAEHEPEPEQVVDVTDMALLALRLSARMCAAKKAPCRTLQVHREGVSLSRHGGL
jgi:hypothetical protein